MKRIYKTRRNEKTADNFSRKMNSKKNPMVLKNTISKMRNLLKQTRIKCYWNQTMKVQEKRLETNESISNSMTDL